MRGSWLVEVVLLGVAVGLARWLAPMYWASPILIAGGYLGWHAFNVARLLRLLDDEAAPTPEGFGIWNEVYDQLYRARQRTDRKQRKWKRRMYRIEETNAALPDAAVALNRQGDIEWLNDAAVSLLGLDPQRDLGHRITNFLRHPEFIRCFNAQPPAGPIEFPSPVDQRRLLQAQIVSYSRRRLLLIARDVSESHRLADVRRDFVANASHELRTPLTVIKGFLDNMATQTDKCPPTWRRPLELMRQQADRMFRIINDMLSLARLESQPRSAPETPIDIPALLTEVCDAGREMSPGKAHAVELVADQELWLLGAADGLRGAFQNLVTNAVQHTPPGGQVRVTWSRNDRRARLEVSDDGEGIAPEHLGRLTERFYRIDVGRSRESGGTGLGLSIVKHTLAQHGAELRIESEIGVGSRFICLFPERRLTIPMRRSA